MEIICRTTANRSGPRSSVFCLTIILVLRKQRLTINCWQTCHLHICMYHSAAWWFIKRSVGTLSMQQPVECHCNFAVVDSNKSPGFMETFDNEWAQPVVKEIAQHGLQLSIAGSNRHKLALKMITCRVQVVEIVSYTWKFVKIMITQTIEFSTFLISVISRVLCRTVLNDGLLKCRRNFWMTLVLCENRVKICQSKFNTGLSTIKLTSSWIRSSECYLPNTAIWIAVSKRTEWTVESLIC